MAVEADVVSDERAQTPAKDESSGAPYDPVEAEIAAMDAEENASETDPEKDEPDPDDAGPEDDADEEVAPLAELEFDGEKFQVPESLKAKLTEGLMLKADHTRKTQEIAETRKSLEAEKTRVGELFQVSDRYIEGRAFLKSIDAQLNQYQKMDWAALEYNDPLSFATQVAKQSQLYQHRAFVVQQTQAAQQEYEAYENQQRQQSVAASQKQLKELMPNFGQAQQKALLDYANKNLNPDTVAAIDGGVDPMIIPLLDKARMWDELQAKKPEAQRKAATAGPVLKTGAPQPKSNPVSELSKRLKSTGTIEDAVALEMAIADRREKSVRR